MKIIALSHKRELHYQQCNDVLDMDSASFMVARNPTLITFARVAAKPRKVSALDRLTETFPGDVILTHVDHSPLMALLVWDITHYMSTGCHLYLKSGDSAAELLSRTYYRDSFEFLHMEGSFRVYAKVDNLPSERASGIDAWSFCIPTGNGDPSSLNACVARILSLDISDSEIILCGRPGEGFRYWSHVRIVGEDFPDTPVHITRKKNLLAREARYPNLCILHDRVLLPKNFHVAVQKFGDYYPFTSFQSLWFADTWQAVPRRYSDFGYTEQVPETLTSKTRPGRECLGVLSALTFHTQHPARADFGRDYLTGSVYICKAPVWQIVEQNETLLWSEYEDVEQGLRAAVAGIPSRLNPFALTQTLTYRSIMHYCGLLSGKNISGNLVSRRAPQEWWGFPRRPHLSIPESTIFERLAYFAHRYTGSDALVRQHRRPMTGIRRFWLISRILWKASGDISAIRNDWFRYVLCEDPAGERGFDETECCAGAARWKLSLLRHPSLTRQIFNNLFSPAGHSSALSAVQSSRGWRRKIGSFISATWLRYGSPHNAFNMSFWEIFYQVYDGALHPQEMNCDAD